MVYETIGDRIRILREAQNYSQTKLAEHLFVKREMVNQWENNARLIKTEYVVKVADFLGVTTDYILRGVMSENVTANKELGLSDKAIAALKLSKNFYPFETNEVLELERELATDDLENDIKIWNLRIAKNTIPCINILLEEEAILFESRVIDSLIEYLTFNEKDFGIQSTTNLSQQDSRKGSAITGQQMSIVKLHQISDSLKLLKAKLMQKKKGDRE